MVPSRPLPKKKTRFPSEEERKNVHSRTDQKGQWGRDGPGFESPLCLLPSVHV